MNPNPFTFTLRANGRVISGSTGCSPNWVCSFTIKGWRTAWKILTRGCIYQVQTTGPEKYDPEMLMNAALGDSDEEAN